MGRYTPRFVLGTGVFLVMFLTLNALGVWQLHRLQWKNELITKVISSDPKTFVPVEEIILKYNNIENIDFIKVRVRGRYLHDQELELVPRTYQGQNGAHVYTPFQLSQSGHIILINRGWVPERKDNITVAQPQGDVEVFGYLQEPLLPGWLTPDNVSHRQIWYYIDLEAVQEEIAKTYPQLAKRMLPFYMFAKGEENAADYPKALVIQSLIKNNHLGYALTWFCLAISLLIMYIIYVRKNRI